MINATITDVNGIEWEWYKQRFYTVGTHDSPETGYALCYAADRAKAEGE